MKKLVIYYSRTGATKKIADEIADKIKADKEEVIDKKNRKGIVGYIIAGKDATFKKLTRIKELKKNPKDYDIVIIGTPVWASAPAPAIRTFLAKIKDYNKKIAFFCTGGGPIIGSIFKQMEEILPNSRLIATLGLSTFEIKLGKQDEKINDFIEKLL